MGLFKKVNLKTKKRYEIILAGLGGQGLILAGVILSAASAIFDRKYVVQTQSYAPLARGAPSRSEIVISNNIIDFPEVSEADLLVALSQDAYDNCQKRVSPNGIIIVDSQLVSYSHTKNSRIISYPLTQIAKEETGKTITTSILALGLIASLTGIISRWALKRSIEDRVPHGTEEVNLKALNAGFTLDKKYKNQKNSSPQ